MNYVLINIFRKLIMWGCVSATIAFVYAMINGQNFSAIFFSDRYLTYTIYMPVGIYAGYVLMKHHRQG